MAELSDSRAIGYEETYIKGDTIIDDSVFFDCFEVFDYMSESGGVYITPLSDDRDKVSITVFEESESRIDFWFSFIHGSESLDGFRLESNITVDITDDNSHHAFVCYANDKNIIEKIRRFAVRILSSKPDLHNEVMLDRAMHLDNEGRLYCPEFVGQNLTVGGVNYSQNNYVLLEKFYEVRKEFNKKYFMGLNGFKKITDDIETAFDSSGRRVDARSRSAKYKTFEEAWANATPWH